MGRGGEGEGRAQARAATQPASQGERQRQPLARGLIIEEVEEKIICGATKYQQNPPTDIPPS